MHQQTAGFRSLSSVLVLIYTTNYEFYVKRMPMNIMNLWVHGFGGPKLDHRSHGWYYPSSTPQIGLTKGGFCWFTPTSSCPHFGTYQAWNQGAPSDLSRIVCKAWEATAKRCCTLQSATVERPNRSGVSQNVQRNFPSLSISVRKPEVLISRSKRAVKRVRMQIGLDVVVYRTIQPTISIRILCTISHNMS